MIKFGDIKVSVRKNKDRLQWKEAAKKVEEKLTEMDEWYEILDVDITTYNPTYLDQFHGYIVTVVYRKEDD